MSARWLVCAVLLATPVGAQAGGAIERATIEEILAYLADDARGGRDTPSAGLEECAHYIAWRFSRARLRPAVAGEYFHRYSLEGDRFDPAAVELTVLGAEPRVLMPGRDVRVWASGRPFEAESVECTVRAADSLGGRGLRRSRAPVLGVVATGSLLWREASGTRESLGGGVPGGAPVLLVREDVLPAGVEQLTARLVVPAPERVSIPLKNVAATLPGTDLAREWVLVTAHFDHVGIRPGGGADLVFNGADDNGTGTTAVLTLAEAFARRNAPPRRSLMFVCFSGEEKGLRGSRAFVADCPIPLDAIAAVVNLEMLGRPPSDARRKAWVTGRTLSDFEAIVAPALARNGVTCIPFAMESQLFSASDNLPFAQRGVVAHSISAGTLHADYHQPGDEVGKIDFEHMTDVVRGVFDAVVELADREARPEWNDDGRARLSGGRRD